MSNIIKCLFCKIPLGEDEIFRYVHAHDVEVCDKCAKVVANAYEDWHGGPVASSTERRHPKVSQKTRWEIFKRDGYVCLHCGADGDLTIDHIDPLINGGTNDVKKSANALPNMQLKEGS